MITHFEQITENLTEAELRQRKNMEAIIRQVMQQGKHYKAPELCTKINYELAGFYSINPVSLRKWSNFFRSNGIIPILATSQGYVLSYDKEMIEGQIRSLQERANSILTAANGLHVFLK